MQVVVTFMSWSLYPNERTPRTTEKEAIFAFVRMGNNGKQDGRCTFNVTLRRVRATIAAVKKSNETRVYICSLRYPACNAHAPYCHLWPASIYCIFAHYLINGTIFGGKKLLNTKCMF
jgi:hypothetical protein